MSTDNPYDQVLGDMVGQMHDISNDLKETFKNVRPFQSVQLKPDESLFLYDHPAQHPMVAGEMDPTLGTPLTNAQAAQSLLQKLGPVQYVKWVETNEAYRQKREAPDAIDTGNA